MYAKIKETCDSIASQFNTISPERKEILEKISQYIFSKKANNELVKLIYICTHNSRRSHFGQIWAKVAADYYKIENIETYSGGTEATAFNINAINALREIGFEVTAITSKNNPVFEVNYNEIGEPIICFSKTYDDIHNPTSNFAAIMTCSDAEENCPFIPGVELRIGTTYDDPKAFDNTSLQNEKYKERALQIALECLYVFSNVK